MPPRPKRKSLANRSATSDGEDTIGEDELRRTYAYILGIPFISLTGTNIKYETSSEIPEPVARRNNIIAYNHRGDELEVAMLDTDDLADRFD